VPIRHVDALALLGFAEHLLFADRVAVSTFEAAPNVANTLATIDLLQSVGCTVRRDGEPLLVLEGFDEPTYKDACLAAAPRIQEDLLLIDPTTMKRVAALADATTQPKDVRSSGLLDWLTRDRTRAERAEVRTMPLVEKARGAYGFLLSSDDALYRQVKILTRPLRSSSKLPQIANFLDVFFRAAINEELAKRLDSVYSPAPRRARILYESSWSFRQALEEVLLAHLERHGDDIASPWLRRVRADEHLPLPLFAIHFLRRKSVGSPIDLLAAAREARDSDEVAAIRSWLSQWETKYCSPDLDTREEAVRELGRLADSLDLARDRLDLHSVFKLDVSRDELGNPSMSFLSAERLGEVARRLWARIHKRRLFLAAVSREVALDADVGVDILRMLGRPLIS
jgi:hypothetical protein